MMVFTRPWLAKMTCQWRLLKVQVTRWIQREIIDDDPYDELTLEESALLTRLAIRRLLES